MDSHLHEMRGLLVAARNDIDAVYVGIWGMGGIGKTTIADAVYRENAHLFDHRCFFKDVREGFMKKEEVKLQLKFLSEILNDKVEKLDGNYDKMLARLGNKKILVVLDDVLDSKQMETSLGKERSFGGGSIIIVTTRDERVVREFKIYKPEFKIYKPELLSDHDALKLFSQNAFNTYKPPGEYEPLSRRIVREYARGLPLALIVLGALLRNRSVPEWEDQFKKMTKYPNPKIEEVLKISYDGLDHSQQNIFLDIACFFKGMDKHYVAEFLVNCGYSPNIDLNVLVERTLVSISESNKLEMHDLLQEMGRDIEKKEETVGRRKRFWSEDAERVLSENTVTECAEGLMIDLPYKEDIFFNAEPFERMRKLRLLSVNYRERYYGDKVEHHRPLIGDLKFLSSELRVLRWYRYPLKCLPSNFDPKNLLELDLKSSRVEQLWEISKVDCAGMQYGNKLTSINLSRSPNLKVSPDITAFPNLKRLDLGHCSSLTEVLPSPFSHDNLVFLSLTYCTGLESLPSSMRMKSLETLDLTECIKLAMFPEISEDMKALSQLKLTQTAIEKLPSSIYRLNGLQSLDMSFCRSLLCLPESICNLAQLRSLNLSRCSKLIKLPEHIGSLESLQSLDMSGCSSLLSLPESICNLAQLRSLNLSSCSKLKKLPENIGSLESLQSLDMSFCSSLLCLPESICNLAQLGFLGLSWCSKLKKLPENIGSLESLLKLHVRRSGLEQLPVSILHLKLSRLSFRGCQQMASPFSSWPSSIEDRCTALVELDFSDCSSYHHLMKLWDGIARFSSLKVLNLSENNMESLPAVMNKLGCLERLDLDSCRRLKSIPKLASSISNINAHNCTALETVLAPQSPYDIGRCFTFNNCSQLVQKDVFKDIVETHFPRKGNHCRPFYLCLPGSEVPEQFIRQRGGNSVTAPLPQKWFDNQFLGFAICAVTTKSQSTYNKLTARCFCTFKGDGCKYRFSFRLFDRGSKTFPFSFNNESDHILVGYEPWAAWSEFGNINGGEAVNERSYTEATFEIKFSYNLNGLRVKVDEGCEPYIKSCGVQFFFDDNVEGGSEVDNSERSLEVEPNTSDTFAEDKKYLSKLLHVFNGANRYSTNSYTPDSKILEIWRQRVRVILDLMQMNTLDDGFNWERENIQRSQSHCLYLCRHQPGCYARATVLTLSDPTIREITYVGRHTCWKTQPMLTYRVGFTPGMETEGPDDGFRWRKYGEMDTRVYYVCNPQNVGGCMAVKEVQCSDDQKFLRITYRLRHTCKLPSVASGGWSVHGQVVEFPSSSGVNGHGGNEIDNEEKQGDEDDKFAVAIDGSDNRDRGRREYWKVPIIAAVVLVLYLSVRWFFFFSARNTDMESILVPT